MGSCVCLNVFGFPQLNEFLEETIELMEMCCQSYGPYSGVVDQVISAVLEKKQIYASALNPFWFMPECFVFTVISKPQLVLLRTKPFVSC